MNPLQADQTPTAPGFVLHLAHLSNAGSLPILAAAKAKGKPSVPHSLLDAVIPTTQNWTWLYLHPANVESHCCHDHADIPIYLHSISCWKPSPISYVLAGAMLQPGAATVSLRYSWEPHKISNLMIIIKIMIVSGGGGGGVSIRCTRFQMVE